MMDWMRKNAGWVAAVVTWVILLTGYVYKRGRETEAVSGLTIRVEKLEPEIKRISSVELKTQELSNTLNQVIVPNLQAINKKLGPLPWAVGKISRLEDELGPIRDLVASRLMKRPLDIFFAFDSSEPRGDAFGVLRLNAAWLRSNPKTKIILEGHADERGTAEYNLGLAERRASAVKEYLVSAGVAANRINITVHGKERPFQLGHDEAAWKWNRRVHFAFAEK